MRHKLPQSLLQLKRLWQKQTKQNPMQLKLILPQLKLQSPSSLLMPRNPRAPWWPCAAMTDPAKRNQFPFPQVAVGLVIAEMAKAHRVLTKVVLAIRAGVVLTVEIEVIALSVKCVVLALVMRRSEPNAMPWNTPKWPCESWLPRPTANP
jgi:hypothetical protein